MYRYFIAVLLGVAAMACDASTSTSSDTYISSLDGLPTGSFLPDPTREICISHILLTSDPTAKLNNPTCTGLLNLDVNKYPFNDHDKLSVPTTREFHSANHAVVQATFKVLGMLHREKEMDEVWWYAITSCADVLMDLRARDVYLRKILPKIEREGIDAWKTTCDYWDL
ncbi:hypothetical protein FPANT_233 [Fusarium pseudoanthophilum]|uniref:Uncharacterized protein n=1 Tax=Fusarium pseudoanthophilum TaxID=48495 RepID=A0A8H5V3G7_9HYPO|nr:hypothetical protein FPANT_233 [Fusarium pseudoanthophilum]